MTELERDPLGARTDELLRAAFERTPIGMSFVTPDRRPLLVNPALVRMLGYSVQEMQGLSVKDFTHPEDQFNHLELHDELLVGQRDWYRVDKRYVHKDGRTVWAMLHVAGVYDEGGQLYMLVSQVYDMSDEVHARERDSWRASHDPLTRVLNRQRFLEHLDERMHPSPRRATPALLLVDVDDLREVNNADGCAAGDDLLRSLADGLSSAVPPDAYVGRVGGDEFAVLLENPGSAGLALERAEEIRLLAVDRLRSYSFATVSIGVALPPPADASRLMNQADAALRRAKEAGKNRAVLGWSELLPG